MRRCCYGRSSARNPRRRDPARRVPCCPPPVKPVARQPLGPPMSPPLFLQFTFKLGDPVRSGPRAAPRPVGLDAHRPPVLQVPPAPPIHGSVRTGWVWPPRGAPSRPACPRPVAARWPTTQPPHAQHANPPGCASAGPRQPTRPQRVQAWPPPLPPLPPVERSWSRTEPDFGLLRDQSDPLAGERANSQSGKSATRPGGQVSDSTRRASQLLSYAATGVITSCAL